MPRHLQREMEILRKKVINLSALVEKNVYLAVKAFMQKDPKLAQQLIDADYEIDRAEIEIEEDCLKIFALYQPVAIDLRFLVAVLKLNNDLERIGDQTVKISERAINLYDYNVREMPIDFSTMAEKVQIMLKESLDALVNMDINLAREVMSADDEVDEMHKKTYKMIHKMVSTNPEHIHYMLDFLSVSGCLERIADHTTNIAEDVIYMAGGEIIRHRGRLNNENF